MARVMVQQDWDRATKEQYEAVRKAVNWEGNRPTGGVLHVAAVDDKGLHMTDVWESPDDFQRFVEQRFMPAVKRLSIPGQPRVHVYPLHHLFTPGL